MIVQILDLAYIAAKTLNTQSRIKYQKRVNELRAQVNDVADSDFYSKDMEKKGKAERELMSGAIELAEQIAKEDKSNA